MARHKQISRTSWQNSQKQILQRWKEKNLHDDQEKDKQAYLALLLKYADDLPQDGAMLEIGCGPTCLSQALPLKNKTFLDPLLDDFRRLYPGELPEGECLASTAEHILKPDSSYDLIVCLNTVSYALNPELIMNEMERLLRPGGRLILTMRIHSPLESRLHYWTTHYIPSLSSGALLNYYSLTGIRNTLGRHFTITDEIVMNSHFDWLPFFKVDERLFACTPVNDKTSPL